MPGNMEEISMWEMLGNMKRDQHMGNVGEYERDQ